MIHSPFNEYCLEIGFAFPEIINALFISYIATVTGTFTACPTTPCLVTLPSLFTAQRPLELQVATSFSCPAPPNCNR